MSCLEWQKYWWKLEKAPNFVTRPASNAVWKREKMRNAHISEMRSKPLTQYKTTTYKQPTNTKYQESQPRTPGYEVARILAFNLVPRACDPREGTRGSGIIRCRKPGILAKIELRIPFQRPIRFLPETDYPRASRSFPRIAGSGNEIA